MLRVSPTGASTRESARNRASVTGVTLGGLRVPVTVPYAYSMPHENETLHADAGSNAVYEVGLTNARRTSGTDVSPC